MPVSRTYQNDSQSQSKRWRRLHHLLLFTVISGGLSLVLYLHGSSFWYAPIAVVIIQVALFGIIAYIAMWTGKRRLLSKGNSGYQQGAGHRHENLGQLIKWPRRYDWLVSVIMLGREKKLRRWVLDIADLQLGNDVLDVGCGTGTLLLAVADHVGTSGTLCGIEPAIEMIEYAKEKAGSKGVSFEIIKGSADSLPYPSDSFDIVLSTLVLHHIPKVKQTVAIREMYRVLKPGGQIVIVDLQKPRSIFRAFTSAMTLISLLHNIAPNTSRFNVLDFESLMTSLGFKDIKQHSFGSGAIAALAGRSGS